MKSACACDVAVIGGGPTGLAAAVRLKKAGAGRVVVVEREKEAGGAPRHCGHLSFGVLEYKRLIAGPEYAKRLVETARAAGVEFIFQASVRQLLPGGEISAISPDGAFTMKAKKVLLATGARETPRSARLVSGSRASGICTTGALQSMFYLKGMVPFRRPVIIGTEAVGFSAILTCKKAGIQPAAMIEKAVSPSIFWPISYLAKITGVPLYCGAALEEINGSGRVGSVRVTLQGGRTTEIECDGVLFTGEFTPESSLPRMSHLAMDYAVGSPVIDPDFRCSDSSYYAAGNLLGPVKMSVTCWRNGNRVADSILKDIV
jgi:thioredoxin reductase